MQVNQFTEALELFVMAKEANDRAPRTIKGYYRCLEPFAEWCKAQGLNVESITRWDFRRYVTDELRSNGWSKATVGIHVRNIRCFLRWLHTEGFKEENLADAVEPPSGVVRLEEPLTASELKRLLIACDEGKYPLRDRALIMAFVDTGLRCGEMSELRRDQVSFEDSIACINRVDPKSKAPKPLFLGTSTTSLLLQYLEKRDDDNNALWLGENGEPLTAEGVNQVIKRRARDAELDRVHPHLFRKTFATCWIRNGGDRDRLKTLGGWKTDEALQVYILLGKRSDLKEAHQKFAPVDNMLEGVYV